MLVGLVVLAGVGALAAALYEGPCEGLEGAAPGVGDVTRAVPTLVAEVGVDIEAVEALMSELDLGPVRAATRLGASPGAPTAAALEGVEDGVFVVGGGAVRSLDTAQTAVVASQRSAPELVEIPVRGAIAVSDPATGETMVLDGDLQQQSCGTIATDGAPLAADEAYAVVAGGDDVTVSPLRPGDGWTRRFPELGVEAAMALPTRVVLVGRDAVVGLEPETGDQQWRLDVAEPRVVEAGDDLTFVVSAATRLLAIDTATGERRWDVDLDAPIRDVAGLDARLLVATPGAVVVVEDGEEVARAATTLPIHAVAASDAYTAWHLDDGGGVGDGGGGHGVLVLAGPAD